MFAFSNPLADFHLSPGDLLDVRAGSRDHAIESRIWAYHVVAADSVRPGCIGPLALWTARRQSAPKVAAKAPAKVLVPKAPSRHR